MADLYNKIKIYLGRDFTSEEVLLQDDQINRVSNPYIKDWNVAEAQPTEEQLNALESQATTLESNKQVIATRKRLYGTLEQQIENIMENGLQSEIDRVNQIKTENPKS